MKVTLFRNNRAVDISAEQIVHTEEGKERSPERDYPYTNITIYDEKDDSTYIVQVVESKSYIDKTAKKEREEHEQGS